jgi:phage terminase small subunit
VEEIIMVILHNLEEEEMEVTEEVMVVIEGEEEEEEDLEEIEVIEEVLVVIEETEVTEALVTQKEEMKEKMEDGMVKIKTGKMSQPIQLNSTTILEMTYQFRKSFKNQRILNQLMKELAPHIQEILTKLKSQSYIMKGKPTMMTSLTKIPKPTT